MKTRKEIFTKEQLKALNKKVWKFTTYCNHIKIAEAH